MTEPLPQDFCPYKGLQPYTEADRAFFFGRERDSEIIASNLYAAHLTVLYGESGVGKSSVLLAGVVPLLRQTPNVAVVIFRWWQDAQFASMLRTEILKAVKEATGKEAKVDFALPLDEFLIACNRILRGPVFFIFDQFEEFFLYHEHSSSAEGFDAEWARSVNRQDVDANFLLSLREDSLSRLDRFRGRVPKLMGNMLRLKHLDEEAGRTAIRKPLEKYNQLLPAGEPPMEIEDALVETLLHEIQAGRVTLGAARGQTTQEKEKGSERIETPFLQMVLTRIWDEERAEGSHVLRLETLERLGGAERIIRTHLDKVMEQLSDSEKDVAAQLFRFLVTPSGSKIAHTTDDLISYAEMPVERVEPVLKLLSSPTVRILRPIAPPPGQEDGFRYEIFHDVLAQAVLDWRTRYSQEQRRLAAERKLAGERASAEAKLRQAQQRARRLRWGATGLSVILIITALLLGVALRQRKDLQKAKVDSRSREIAAYALDNADYDPDLSLRLAVTAAEIGMTQHAIDALKEALFMEQTRFVLRGHEAEVRGVAFSPDGKYLATSSWGDKTARVWEVETGKLVSVLGEHQGPVPNVAFSPDGNYIVTASNDKQVRVWADWKTNAPQVIARREEQAGLWSATFSPDGRYILITGMGLLDGWEWKADPKGTGPKMLWKVPERQEVWNAVFSPDGEYFVVGAKWGVIVWKWDTSAGARARTPAPLQPTNSSYRVAFSHDGNYVAGICGTNVLCVWDWKKPDDPHYHVLLSNSSLGIQGVAFSPDDNIVATGQRDGPALLWQWRGETPQGGRKPQELLGHVGTNSMIWALAFSPDGKLLATVSQDKTARIWNLQRIDRNLLNNMTPQELLKMAENRIEQIPIRPLTPQEITRYLEEK
ncbi:MAG: WD40 repeat domain-containing protein [Pyrinomonadaceae bacterium]|nr:WD40 repeat domain-containing protein [Pyrinomonadaceae bacterium]